MTVGLEKLRRLRVYEQSTFTEDHSGTLGDYVDVDALEGTVNGQRGQVSNAVRTVRQNRTQIAKDVLGPKSASMAFQTHLCGHGLDLDGDVNPPTKSDWWFLKLLAGVYGGLDNETPPSAQTTVQSGTTSTVVNVTTGHGSRFKHGGAIGCITSNGYELREVLSVATDAVSVKVAFSGTPTTGQPVRRPVTVYRTTPTTWFSFAEEGDVGYDRWHYRGMQGSVGYQHTWGGPVVMPWQFQGPRWDNLGTSSLAAASITQNTPIVMNTVEMLLATVGSTTRTAIGAQAISIEPDMPWIMQHGTGGLETVIKMVPGYPADAGVQVKITEPFEDLARFTSRDALTDFALFMQIGNAVGYSVLHSIPKGHLVALDRADSEGLTGQSWGIKGRNDSTGGTGAINIACERLHFG